jgi:hypothetical protein
VHSLPRSSFRDQRRAISPSNGGNEGSNRTVVYVGATQTTAPGRNANDLSDETTDIDENDGSPASTKRPPKPHSA